MRRALLRSFLLVLGNVLVILACAVFASGFFPYKPLLQGLAHFEPLLHGAAPTAHFEKIVFMVVDALRR